MGLNKFDFLIEAIKTWKQSGTITQSSPFLCNAMTEHLSHEHAFIAEFGAGDGVITHYILNKMPEHGKLLAFEINESLYDKLVEIKDPRLIPIFDSAENLHLYLKEQKIEKLDAVISAIPFVVLPTELTLEILSQVKKNLKRDGLFIQFNYSKILKDLYISIFHNCSNKLILRNTPPAFVFKCIKKESDRG